MLIFILIYVFIVNKKFKKEGEWFLDTDFDLKKLLLAEVNILGIVKSWRPTDRWEFLSLHIRFYILISNSSKTLLYIN